MRNILLDTNILYSGLWTAALQALCHLVDQGVIALHVPDMVKREKVTKVTVEIENELNKKLSHSLRSLGRIHAGRLRHYAPHACAPYLKVSFLKL